MLQYADFDQPLNDLTAAGHWYVGFSGGTDSTVLLHLLHAWCRANPVAPPLSAIHINHALQPAAPAWQDQCERLCESLAVPIVTRTVDVAAAGTGEAGARDARYAVFDQQLQPGDILFLAHHLDDQVETFFLRLMRGAGIEGLAAMPARRALGAGTLVRPLLDYSRDQIEIYADEHKLDCVTDPSNRDTAIDRNFLRAEVLPLLATRWPAYRQAVSRARTHTAAASAAVAAEIGVPATIHSAMGDPGLSAEALIAPEQSVAAMRLRAWLRASNCRAPDQVALEEFLRQLRAAATDANPQLDSGDYILQRFGDGVYRVPAFGEPPPTQELSLAAGESRAIPGVGIVNLEPADKAGWCLSADDVFTLRWRVGGERCRLPGRAGSHSLKKLLQEWAIPPWWRSRIPLLYLGDELLAIGNIARCDAGRWREAPPEGGALWAVRWERVFEDV